MGYSPRHAKPLSLRSAGLKSYHRPFGSGDSGRHRAGTIVPAPRVPVDDDAIPAEAAETTDSAVPADEVGTLDEGGAAGAQAGDRDSQRNPAAGAGGQADFLAWLIPVQRSPLEGS